MPDEKMAQGVDTSVGNMADITKRHAERGAASSGPGSGRPPLPPSGDASVDRKRERDRARYAERKGRPYIAPAPGPDAPPMFTADTCRPLVGLPFAIANAAAHTDSFTLEESEESLLSSTLAPALCAWFPNVDPRYATLAAFSLALIQVFGVKYAIYKEEKRNAKDKPAAPASN